MKLLITRPLPALVVDAARKTFDVTVREDTSVPTGDELRSSLLEMAEKRRTDGPTDERSEHQICAL